VGDPILCRTVGPCKTNLITIHTTEKPKDIIYIYNITPKQEESTRTMILRDRTTEFVNVIRSLKGRHEARTVTVRKSRKAKYIESYSEFMKIARTIGKNAGSTCTKLEKLNLLVKRKSLFNDRSREIQELAYIIKEDLNCLNQQTARLREVVRNQEQSQQYGRQILSHSSSVVRALETKHFSMFREYKQVLELRTENLKQLKNRRDEFSHSNVTSSFPPSAISGHHQGSVLLAEGVCINMEEHSPLLPVAQKQELIYDETDNYLQIRAETMQNIESTVVELGGIFQQLAHVVKEQGDMVERIDANVQEADVNVEGAHNEIVRYFQNITSNRRLMIKIFPVLIFFFLFFVIFMA
jgi:syntaxin 5